MRFREWRDNVFYALAGRLTMRGLAERDVTIERLERELAAAKFRFSELQGMVLADPDSYVARVIRRQSDMIGMEHVISPLMETELRLLREAKAKGMIADVTHNPAPGPNPGRE